MGYVALRATLHLYSTRVAKSMTTDLMLVVVRHSSNTLAKQ